jgi:NADH:ubiquinone oxidoreductase subunit F (NADH-binding)
MIVQELNGIQHRCGYLPNDELRALAERIREPLYRLHAVASFFPHYKLEPAHAVEVLVCRDMSCHLRGACRLQENLAGLGHELGGQHVEVKGVSCLGQCDRAPAVSINDRIYRGLPEGQLRAIIRSAHAKEPLREQRAEATPPPWKIDPYNGQPQYAALRRVVKERNFDWLLGELEKAKLIGMGGAGFPTHLKWKAVRKEPGPVKYVVCNGDESEPGTFKDREILRCMPYLLVEGIVLAGLTSGATRGYIYIRHEFQEEIEAVQQAIRDAQAQGLCGERILGTELSFPVEVFISPGGYICGEESALLEAMEDRRAEPRNKPPFPTQAGLYGKPTVINNVETLSWVPAILAHGGEWYAGQGQNGATGLRLVSISGDVNKPGVYETPFGLTVRELVMDIAGGMRDGQTLKAIATSGPSSGYLPAVLPGPLPEKFLKARSLPAGTAGFDILDMPLDGAHLKALDNYLGAAFVAVGDRACIVDMALNTTEFFRNESCGKCVPCRVGSQKLSIMLAEMARGTFQGDLGIIGPLADTMTTTSICGLGMVASMPMTTLLKYFREELQEHLKGRCPAGVCGSNRSAAATGVAEPTRFTW